MVATMYKERTNPITWQRDAGYGAEPLNIESWMEAWRHRFDSLGVEVIVADVAQSSVVIDVPARTLILAPSLKVTCAEKILQKVYGWWRQQHEMAAPYPCSFLSC